MAVSPEHSSHSHLQRDRDDHWSLLQYLIPGPLVVLGILLTILIYLPPGVVSANNHSKLVLIGLIIVATLCLGLLVTIGVLLWRQHESSCEPRNVK